MQIILIRYPLVILEDVSIKVGNFTVPIDFVILVMDENSRISIILERPFFATAGAMINVKNYKLSLKVGEDKIEFNVSKEATVC